MEYFIRFEQPWLAVCAFVCLVFIWVFRRWWHKPIVYRYSLGAMLSQKGYASSHPFHHIFYWLRLLSLLLLTLLVGKPQLVDSRSNMHVDGIDIMVVLDASGSMQYQDYSEDKRSRFEVAKEEAIRFINKRVNDAVGLVVFGKDAVSRCPLSLDKKVVTDMVKTLKIGDLDPDGTMLATGMITAVNRLKNSKAKSKVMILLTDGEPSEGDMDPNAACAIAKKLKIKVYTVGIGSERDEMMMHPLYGMVVKPKVNAPLLQMIARETGGKHFMAHNAQDMRAIYDTIDQLERTEYETPLYSRFFDIFVPFTISIFIATCLEIILSSSVWLSI